jgi:hypothetical protein
MRSMGAEANLMKVAVLENEIEARLLDSILSEMNIPHLIRSYHSGAYNGIFQLQMGWGSVFAPPSAKEEILQILKELRENRDPSGSL